MARKPPSLEHVKYVTRRGKVYAYFNTGQKRDGKPIYAPMPQPGSVGFFDSYAALKAGRTKRAKPGYTVANLADEYERSAEFAAKAANTQLLYGNQLNKIAEHWGMFPVDDLQPQDIRFTLDNAGWNPGTRNMVIAVLGALYTWARRRDKATLSPVKDIERLKGGEHEPWPLPIVEAGLKSDDPVVRLGVHLLYFTGLRIGDACALPWWAVADNVITVTPEKTKRHGKRLHIPLTAALKAELDRTPRTGLTILHSVDHKQLRAKLKAFTKALGVETVPHGLRKNAVNTLLEEGCSIAEVASLTGQTYQVVEHYAAKVNTRKLASAAIVKFDRSRGKIGK